MRLVLLLAAFKSQWRKPKIELVPQPHMQAMSQYEAIRCQPEALRRLYGVIDINVEWSAFGLSHCLPSRTVSLAWKSKASVPENVKG